MHNRKIKISDLSTTTPNQIIRIEVYYSEGGMSMLAGEYRTRGYYLSVTPLKIEGAFTRMMAYTGTCTLLEEVKRFSASKLEENARKAQQLPLYQRLITHVLEKNQLQLVTPPMDSPTSIPEVAKACAPNVQTDLALT